MNDVTTLWNRWQTLLTGFAGVFTRKGWVRFVQWVTGMVLCWEEHTLTQIVTATGAPSRWRVLESFAEEGAFHRPAVEGQTLRLIEQECPARWGGYHPVAVDDTKLHRTSANVWGTCTFYESTARSPNRATTVRAHNWVVAGDLVVGAPWDFLPHSGRLYFRQSQLPDGETFQTKPQLAVALLRQADTESEASILGIFDGAYAVKSVISPCLNPKAGQRRIECLTRLRADARLYRPVRRTPHTKGRPRTWGERLPAPRDHEQWKEKWQSGQAFLYGQARTFEYKQMRCYWAVSGPQIAVHVFVFKVEGYEREWYLVTSALDLTAEQVVEAFAARFRQEDSFRDHKQRMGMEECRAWTKEPVLRTFQVQMIALTLLRLLQRRLNEAWGAETWWVKPEWYRHKDRASIQDLRRLFWRHRDVFSQLLTDLEEHGKNPSVSARRRKSAVRAA